jgi:hypothetical protein
MSLWKKYKIKKQQKAKRAKKVLKAREEVLSLLAADKIKKAGELASAVLAKYPGDIRVWRLVAGVKAWERFAERIKGIPPKRREELKSSAIKLMRRELTSRDNLKAEVLAETLISLIPSGEVVEEEAAPAADEVSEEASAETSSALQGSGAEKKAAAKKPSASRKRGAAAKPSEKSSSAKKKTK